MIKFSGSVLTCLICLMSALYSPGQTVALSGTVTNSANGQKLAGAIVELAKAKLTDTTDSLGAYRLGGSSGIADRPLFRRDGLTLSFGRDMLAIRSSASIRARLSLLDLGGRRLAGLFEGRLGIGTTHVTLPPSLPKSDVLLLRLDTDGGSGLFKLVPSATVLLLQEMPVGTPPRNAARPAGKTAAALDTLRVKLAGYKTRELAVEAYTGVYDLAMEPMGVGCTGGTLCWDFEEGRVPDGWTAYRNEFTGTILVDATRPHKGGFALHAKDLAGGKEGNSGGPKKTLKFTLPPNFGPVLWGRAYVYTTPARPLSHAGIFNARYPRPGSASTAVNTMDWYEFATYQQTYMAVWHPPEPPGFPEWVLQSDKQLILNDWTCLEWQFDGANGANPEAADPRVWVDGMELPWPKKFVFSDPAGAAKPKMEKVLNFTFLETGIYLYQGLTLATNWWIDDLAVGAQRIGCN